MTPMVSRCTCAGVAIGSHDNAIAVSAPTWSVKQSICLDRCIADEVQWLWSQGVETCGSCCGHGEQLATICPSNLINAVKMIRLGYAVELLGSGALVAELTP